MATAASSSPSLTFPLICSIAGALRRLGLLFETILEKNNTKTFFVSTDGSTPEAKLGTISLAPYHCPDDVTKKLQAVMGRPTTWCFLPGGKPVESLSQKPFGPEFPTGSCICIIAEWIAAGEVAMIPVPAVAAHLPPSAKMDYLIKHVFPHYGLSTTLKWTWKNPTTIESSSSVLSAAPTATKESAFQPGFYHVNVVTLSGTTHQIDLMPDWFVETLRTRIQDKSGIPPDQQRLVWNGKQLEDGRRLDDYKIPSGDKMTLVLRMRGGMYHFSSGRDGAFVQIMAEAPKVARSRGDLIALMQRLCKVESFTATVHTQAILDGPFAALAHDPAVVKCLPLLKTTPTPSLLPEAPVMMELTIKIRNTLYELDQRVGRKDPDCNLRLGIAGLSVGSISPEEFTEFQMEAARLATRFMWEHTF